MKKWIAVAALQIISIPQAFSKVNSFEGLGLSVGVDSVFTNVNYQDDSASNLNRVHYGETTLSADLDLSYTKSLNSKYLMGLGYTRDLNDANAGQNETIVIIGQTVSTDFRYKLKVRHHFSFYLQPTYMFDPKTAVFAKLGYHQAQLTVSDPNGQIITPTPYSNSKKAHGFGYGLGMKHFLSSHVFAQADTQLMHYQEVKIYPQNVNMYHYRQQLNTAITKIGVGYQF